MRKFVLFSLILAIVSCGKKRADEIVEIDVPVVQEESVNYEFGFPTDMFQHVEGQIKKNEFFANLMSSLGVTNSDSYALTVAAEGVFDLRKIKVGNPYKAYYTDDETPKLAYLVYEDSKTTFVTFGLHDSIFVYKNVREIERRLVSAEATINISLWQDLYNAGLPPALANELSDIYQWSIDFHGLQRGDHFHALYEELYVGDKFVDIGEVFTSIFTHAGRSYDAYRFVQDEIPQYWNGEGENLKKAFLKAPLTFKRISSGFSYARRHPVTRVVRPHTGVDYAAPTGTPVVSIGDGVVTQRAYAGGGGNTVKIKHNSVYTSGYLHLSKYAAGLTVGSRVRQGEVIGYVGSTGVSTGPHLDFRVWKNGSPINPLTMESPPSDPIKEENKEAFLQEIKNMKQRTDSLASVKYVDMIVNYLGGKEKDVVEQEQDLSNRATID